MAETSSYRKMARRTRELWADLQQESGVKLLLQTGAIAIGEPDSKAVSDAMASHDGMDVPYEVLAPAETMERFPMLRLDRDEIAVLDQATCVGFPERAVAAHIRLAQDRGANVRTNETVRGWRVLAGQIEVETVNGTYLCERLVLSAGGWTGDLLDGDLDIISERQVMGWFKPERNPDLFSSERCPVLILSSTGSHDYTYAVPNVLGEGMRFALHLGGVLSHPDRIDRQIHADDIGKLQEAFRGRVLGLSGEAYRASVCFYPHAPDRVFCIGRHPRHDDVVIATGSSGHGFRWSPVVGEIVADLVDGFSSVELEPFDIRRFRVGRARGI